MRERTTPVMRAEAHGSARLEIAGDRGEQWERNGDGGKSESTGGAGSRREGR